MKKEKNIFIRIFSALENRATWIELYPYILVPGFIVNYLIYPFVDISPIPWMLLVTVLVVALGHGSWEDIKDKDNKRRKISNVAKIVGREELPKLWIPLIGFILMIGLFNYSVVAQFIELNPLNWENLLMPLSVILGISGYRDIKLKRQKRLNDYKRWWIALSATGVCFGLLLLMVFVPFAEMLGVTIIKVEWWYMVAALGLLLGIKGLKDKYLSQALEMKEMFADDSKE